MASRHTPTRTTLSAYLTGAQCHCASQMYYPPLSCDLARHAVRRQGSWLVHPTEPGNDNMMLIRLPQVPQQAAAAAAAQSGRCLRGCRQGQVPSRVPLPRRGTRQSASQSAGQGHQHSASARKRAALRCWRDRNRTRWLWLMPTPTDRCRRLPLSAPSSFCVACVRPGCNKGAW